MGATGRRRGDALGALYHLIRIGPLAVDAIARASGHRARQLGEASVTPGLGPFLVLAGALAAMAAGVLLLAAGTATRAVHAAARRL